MARRVPRPDSTTQQTLSPVTTVCPACGGHLYSDYSNFRTVTAREVRDRQR